MLHITIVAVGRLKERFWTEACAEYAKRISGYAQLDVKEVADVDPNRVGGEQQAIEQEGKSILSAIPENSSVVLMDIRGKQVSSEDIARKLDDFALNGKNDICFVIGGSCGTSEEVRKRCDHRWSFGPITLPHNLARVVLLEQIYRAFKINRGEPYHK